MKRVELVIYGDPMGKQRPRVSMKGGFVRTYTPEKTTSYENLIKHEYTSKYGRQVFVHGEPIRANVIAYFGLNKGDFGKKGLNKSGREKIGGVYATIKPDIDNALKVIFDALNTICYPDDNQIVQVSASKCYTLGTPRVEITLESLREL